MQNKAIENLVIEHLRGYRENPIASGVFEGTSSFHGQVEQFYNLKDKEFDSQKKGRTPESLIEIVAPLSEDTFREDLLEYDTVREGCRKYKRNGLIRLLINVGLIGCGFSLVSIYEDTNSSLEKIGILSVLAGGFSLIIQSENKVYNPALKEYYKLHKAACEADGLVKELTTEFRK